MSNRMKMYLLSMIVLSTCPIISGSMPDQAPFMKKTVGAVIGVSLASYLAYELAAWYRQPYDPLIEQEKQESQESSESTRLDDLKNAAKYSFMSLVGVLATYKCAILSMDKVGYDDVKDCHDTFERAGEPKGGPEWEELIGNAYLLRRQKIFAACFPYGALSLVIPYLAVKHKVPHKAYYYLKKALT